MNAKKIILPILLFCLCSCASEKQINKDKAFKRAENYDPIILEKYQDKVTETTTWELERSGCFEEGKELEKSIPTLEETTSYLNKEQYFYTVDKLKAMNTNPSTSDGIETTTSFYTYFKTGLKIVVYSKIKSKTSGISFTGFESTETYILDDGRVDHVVKERKISTDKINDDFDLSGSYHYRGNITITWLEAI